MYVNVYIIQLSYLANPQSTNIHLFPNNNLIGTKVTIGEIWEEEHIKTKPIVYFQLSRRSPRIN